MLKFFQVSIVMLEAFLISLKRISYYLQNNNAYRVSIDIENMIDAERRATGKPAIIVEDTLTLDDDCCKNYPGNTGDDCFRGGV